MANTTALELTDKISVVESASARQLHDKAARGETLTEAEAATLDAWYERQDGEENALLVSNTPPSATLRNLRSEVGAASAQMLAVTQHIQTLVTENEALRHEIATLSQQLPRVAPLQTA